MRNSVLPVMGVLVVVAGAVGLQLGESAIAQIDPIHFEGPAEPARDVSRDPRPPRGSAFARAYGWAEGYQARAEDCGDCPALLTRRTHAPQPIEPLFAYSDPTIEPRWEQAAAEMGAEDLRVEREMIRSSSVQRYLHYPVSADQAEIRAGLHGEAEAPDAEPIGL